MYWFSAASMPLGMMVEAHDLPTLELPAVTEDMNARWRERWLQCEPTRDMGEWEGTTQ